MSIPDETPTEPMGGDEAAEPRVEEQAEPHSVDEQIGLLEAEVEDLKGRLLRARADYDNLQKRQARDAALERERVKARFIEGFLQVFEYSQMAVVEAEKSPGPLAEGVKMVSREFERLLEAEGVLPIAKVGDLFDKDKHEAVSEEPSDQPAGTILRVARQGYLLGERVLRYATVVVSQSDEN